MPQFPPGQTLLIDADDTLWENNIYFERAIAAFISYLNHHEYSPTEVRTALNAVERETILAHGYGLTSFTRSLVAVYEKLSPGPITEHNLLRVRSFTRSIAGKVQNWSITAATFSIEESYFVSRLSAVNCAKSSRGTRVRPSRSNR